jgi:DNA-binding MarR family transcriptional regulator
MNDMSNDRSNLLTQLTTEVRAWQSDQELFDDAVAALAGLNRTDWRCLDILSTRGAMTAGQLADAARLTTGAVTGVLDHLEAVGLVRRVRDTADRRRIIVETTEEMERQAAVVYGPLIADSNRALRAFDTAQLATIVDFIRAERAILGKHTARVRAQLTAPTQDQPTQPPE